MKYSILGVLLAIVFSNVDDGQVTLLESGVESTAEFSSDTGRPRFTYEVRESGWVFVHAISTAPLALHIEDGQGERTEHSPSPETGYPSARLPVVSGELLQFEIEAQQGDVRSASILLHEIAESEGQRQAATEILGRIRRARRALNKNALFEEFRAYVSAQTNESKILTPTAQEALAAIGSLAYESRNDKLCIEALRPVVEFRRAYLPPRSGELRAALQELSFAYKMTFQPVAALPLELELIDSLRATRDENDKGLLRSQANHATTLGATGQLAAAAALYEQVLPRLLRTFSEADPLIQQTRIEFGVTLSNMGQKPRACELYRQAIAVLERTAHPDSPNLQIARLNLGGELIVQGLPGQALEVLETALESMLRTEPTGSPRTQNVRSNLGIAMIAVGRHEDAAEVLSDAVRHFRGNVPPTYPGLLNAELALGEAELALGRLEAARGRFEEVGKRLSPLFAPEPYLRSRLGLARVLDLSGQPDAADALYRQVVDTAQKIRPTVDGYLHQTLAELLNNCGRFEDASALLDPVVAFFLREHPDDSRMPRLVYQYGDVLLAQGRVAESLAIARGTYLRFNRSEASSSDAMTSLREVLGFGYYRQGDHLAARELFAENYESLRDTLGPDALATLSAQAHMGHLAWITGDSQSGRQILEDAREKLRASYPEHPALLECSMNLAMILKEENEYDRALQIETEAMAIAQGIYPPEHPNLARGRLNIAGTHGMRGDHARAAVMLRELGRSAADTLPAGHVIRIRSKANLFSSLMALGRSTEALELLPEILTEIQQRLTPLREPLSPREMESAAVQTRWESDIILSHLVEAQPGVVATGRPVPEVGLELTETMRGVAADYSRSLRFAEARTKDEEFARLRRQLRDVAMRTADLQRSGSTTALLDAVRQRDELQRQVSQRIPKVLGHDRLHADIDVGRIRSALGKDELAITYWRYRQLGADGRGHASYVAFLLRRDSPVEIVPLGPAKRLESAIEEWRKQLVASGPEDRGIREVPQDRRPTTAAAETLSRLLLEPCRKHLDGVGKIIVVPDDALYLVPFDALAWEGGILGDRYEIIFRNSLRELLTEEPPTAGDNMLLLVGAIDYGSAPGAREATTRSSEPFAALPGTLSEIRSVASTLEKNKRARSTVVLLSGPQATRSAFLEAAEEARHVHLATHAYFAPDGRNEAPSPTMGFGLSPDAKVRSFAPMTLCGVVFAGANQVAGSDASASILTGEELATVSLTNCELAVLSACETGLGVRRAGQGVQSLQQALHATGARSTLTSLWAVDDEATQLLMKHFYEALWSEGMTKAGALRSAKSRMRAQKRDDGTPRFDASHWAAWILMGDPD